MNHVLHFAIIGSNRKYKIINVVVTWIFVIVNNVHVHFYLLDVDVTFMQPPSYPCRLEYARKLYTFVVSLGHPPNNLVTNLLPGAIKARSPFIFKA